MAQLLVGDSDCTWQEIALIFDEPSISTLKVTWWTSLAMLLNIPLDSVKKWQQDLILDKLTNIDIILEMLTQWRMIKGTDATLGALYYSIPNDIKQFKEFLQAKIRKKAKFWKDLDADSQTVVLDTNVKVLGRNYVLSSLQNMITKEKFEEIINKQDMTGFFRQSFHNENWDLGHYPTPKPLPKYIPRKLTLKRKLNPAIFKHKCSDIFLIEGIQRHHLSILARRELTEVSSEQLKKVTRRFILLEHPDDCDEIVKVTEYPVHRIKQEDGQFYWFSTKGSCQVIREFLSNDVEEIDETILIQQHLSTFNNHPIAICSSPGMGKSTLLANMAHEILKIYPNRMVLYLESSSLVPTLSSTETELKIENIRQILASILSINVIGCDILLALLQNKDIIFEVFLDGLDEMSFEYIQLAKQFIKCLLGSPNMRIYITSRLHIRHEIESTLEVISLDIAPFNQGNQVDFLCDFWKLNPNITNQEKLRKFALTVLKSLDLINLNISSETEFSGVPLQCFMLAQVYKNHARMYSNRDNFNFDVTNSLYELYTKFTNFNFKKIQTREIPLIKMYHWIEALSLLFPDNQEATQIVQELTMGVKSEEVPWKKIFTVGILEPAPNKPKFVHRTFAEYLLAEFIVEELLINEIVDINISVRFINDSVLFMYNTYVAGILSEPEFIRISKFMKSSPYSRTDNLKHIFPEDNVLQHELICNFVEGALGKYEKILHDEKLRRCKYDSTSSTYDWGQLKLKLLVCTKYGFHYMAKTLVDFCRGTSILSKMSNMDHAMSYCTELLLCASANGNVEFFKYISSVVKSFPDFNFTAFSKLFAYNDMLQDRTPLSKSISTGNYNVVEYLIKCYGDELNECNEWWLACFNTSFKDSPKTITDKVKVLNLLKSPRQSPQIEALKLRFPIIGVNVVLLTSLFDLCKYVPSEKDVEFMIRCVSFCCIRETEIDHIVNWLLSKNLANLLTHHYQSEPCLLALALQKNLLKSDTFTTLYKKKNFDLSIVLKPAVECERSNDMIKAIVDLSNDVNLVDDSKSTLLHWAARSRKLNAINYLLSVAAAVNIRNAFGSTPLHNVFQNRVFAENFHLIHDIVSLFVTNKADVCAKNIAGLSALQLAKTYQAEMCIEEKTLQLLENGVRHNDSTEDGSTAFFRGATDAFKNTNHLTLFTIIEESALSKCFPTFVKNMVKFPGIVNMTTNQNKTLLHFAAMFLDREAMEYLLLKGADTNVKDTLGDTPLHLIFNLVQISSKKHLNINNDWIHECVELLLKHNADASIRNHFGKTPLYLAKQHKNNLRVEDRTIRLLFFSYVIYFMKASTKYQSR